MNFEFFLEMMLKKVKQKSEEESKNARHNRNSKKTNV